MGDDENIKPFSKSDRASLGGILQSVCLMVLVSVGHRDDDMN